jgi:hypothetical protein
MYKTSYILSKYYSRNTHSSFKLRSSIRNSDVALHRCHVKFLYVSRSERSNLDTLFLKR